MASGPADVVIPGGGLLRLDLRGTLFEIDEYIFHSEGVCIYQQYADGTGAELPHLVDLCRKYGSPPDTTAKEAILIWNEVCKRVAAEKKDGDPTPSSPGTTGSTPGPSPPASGTP